MIITEHYMTRPDGVELCKTVSDEGYYIRQMETGEVYDEAIDITPCPYTYEETDELIPAEITIEAKAAAYDILMGGDGNE